MNRKRILVLVAILAIAVYFGYSYLYQEHRDIQKEIPTAAVTSNQLSEKFIQNASNDLLNSTVLVSGVITEMDVNSITLDAKINCSFEASPDELEIGQMVKVKGRCIGYDDLFEIVKLDQCSIVK